MYRVVTSARKLSATDSEGLNLIRSVNGRGLDESERDDLEGVKQYAEDAVLIIQKVRRGDRRSNENALRRQYNYCRQESEMYVELLQDIYPKGRPAAPVRKSLAAKADTLMKGLQMLDEEFEAAIAERFGA